MAGDKPDVHEADAEHDDHTRVLGGKVPIALHELRELAGDDLAVDSGHCVGRRLRGEEIKGEIWSCVRFKISTRPVEGLSRVQKKISREACERIG